MATEAPQLAEAPAETPAEALTHDAPPFTPGAEAAAKPPVKRSWRRKFRKMRIKFDDAMSHSSALIVDEWKAMGTARRLQAENDQLLDALLDFNNQPRVPARRRFELVDAAADVDADAALVDAAQIEAATEAAHADHAQHADRNNHDTHHTDLDNHDTHHTDHNNHDTHHTAPHTTAPNTTLPPQRGHTTLAGLEATVPHTTLADLPALPHGIDLSEHAPGYMSPQHEEEYLLALDHLLEDPSFEEATRHHRTLHLGPSQPPLSEKDLTIRNPDSVYNWLRKNQPQVFLQDKDAPHHDTMSEKAAPKPATKKSRPSNVGGRGTPGPKEDHDGEDSAAPEGKAKPKKGAADPDDTAYRPKGGSSRPSKRKRDAADADAKGARKKNRPSAAAAAAPPPTG